MTTTPTKRFPNSVPGEPARSRLLEFLALHCGMGAAIGIGLAGLVVLTNLGGMRDLLKASNEPYVPMILFFASFALTFASAKMGMAVMALPLERADTDSDDDIAGVADPFAPDSIGGSASIDGSAEATKPATDPNRLLGRRE